MGTSFTILKKNPLELSVEIDRDIKIEISTGFVGSETNSQTSSFMTITTSELDEIITELTKVKDSLNNYWTCGECLALNSADWRECNTCDEVRNN
jgi:hypothetical protein